MSDNIIIYEKMAVFSKPSITYLVKHCSQFEQYHLNYKTQLYLGGENHNLCVIGLTVKTPLRVVDAWVLPAPGVFARTRYCPVSLGSTLVKMIPVWLTMTLLSSPEKYSPFLNQSNVDGGAWEV